MAKLSITQLDLHKKRVFLRADFNVPLSEDGKVTDDTRIRETLPTIEHALRNGARVIAASHLGRPKGKPNPKMSLKPVAERLRKLLREQKTEAGGGLANDCGGGAGGLLRDPPLRPPAPRPRLHRWHHPLRGEVRGGIPHAEGAYLSGQGA